MSMGVLPLPRVEQPSDWFTSSSCTKPRLQRVVSISSFTVLAAHSDGAAIILPWTNGPSAMTKHRSNDASRCPFIRSFARVDLTVSLTILQRLNAFVDIPF